MELNIERLKRFIEVIKTIGFWHRLFGWGTIRTQLVDAAADLQKLLTAQESNNEQLQQQRQQISDLTKDLAIVRDQSTSQREAILEFESKEAQRQSDYARQVATLNSIQERIQSDGVKVE